MKIYS